MEEYNGFFLLTIKTSSAKNSFGFSIFTDFSVGIRDIVKCSYTFRFSLYVILMSSTEFYAYFSVAKI